MIINATWGPGDKARCLHCGREWYVRKEGRPVQCPQCKRLNWDAPKASEGKATVPPKVVSSVPHREDMDENFDFGL